MNKLHRFFFSLTIIFLPVQLGKHFWPEWSFILGRRVDYLSPTLYLTDIFIALTVVSWFISSISRIRKNYELGIKNFKIINPKSLFLILLWSFLLINIYGASNKLATMYFFLKIFEFTAFGFYIAKTKPSLSRITLYISLAVLYSSVIAIVQFFFQRSIGGPLWFLGERTFSTLTPGIAQINFCFTQCRLLLRPYATFPHPNVLGGFLAVTLPLIIIQSRKKVFYLLTTILGFVALFLSFSRSAWMAGTLAIIMIFIPKKLRGLYIIFSVLIFFLGIFFIKNFDASGESVVVREELNSVAISLWRQFPVAGVGLGNFLVNLPKALPSRTIFFLQPVHNIYLLILSETGFLGLIFFTVLIISCLKIYDVRFTIYEKKQSNSKFLILNSLFLILLLGLVDHYPLTLQQGQILFTLLISLSFL